MNFETLGIATAFVVGWLLVVLLALGALELTWMLTKRAVGMTRILKAIEAANTKGDA